MELDEPIDDDEDADVPVVPGPVDVCRLPDLGGWEVYKVIDDDEEIRTISLRVVGRKYSSVAFAIFHDVNQAPVETGEIELVATDAAPLDDAGRVRILRDVLRAKDPDFNRYGDRLDFAFTRRRGEDEAEGADEEEE